MQGLAARAPGGGLLAAAADDDAEVALRRSLPGDVGVKEH
jgi:hypothetical protein